MASRKTSNGDVSSSDVNVFDYNQKEDFFLNLLALGFDSKFAGNKYKFEFHKNMFDVPNKDAFEVIIYFLFYKLNKNECKEKFKYCYPITDARTDQEYRKIASTWLAKIANENPQFKFPMNIPSLLLRRAGRNFYNLLFSFSHYVLWENLRTECEDEFLLSLPEYDYGLDSIQRPTLEYIKLCKAQEDQLLREIALFQDQINSKYDHWINSSKKLSEQYYSHLKITHKVNKDLNKLFDDLQLPRVPPEVILNDGEGNGEWLEFFNEQKASIEEINEQWAVIKELLNKDSSLWEVYDSVQSESSKYELDFEDINNNMSENLKNYLAKNCTQKTIHLENIIEICNNKLSNINSVLEQRGIPNLSDIIICEDSVKALFSTLQKKSEDLLQKMIALKQSTEIDKDITRNVPKECAGMKLVEPSPGPNIQYCGALDPSELYGHLSSPKLNNTRKDTDLSYDRTRRQLFKSEQELSNRRTSDCQRRSFLERNLQDELQLVQQNLLIQKETDLTFGGETSVSSNHDPNLKTPKVQRKKQASAKFSAAHEFRLELLDSPLTPDRTPELDPSRNPDLLPIDFTPTPPKL